MLKPIKSGDIKMEKSIHDGHRQRMRERFKNDLNFNNFEEHEILEMLLFYCFPRCNTNDIAHELLNKFGSISNVLSAPIEDLTSVKMLGDSAATKLKFFNALNIYLHLQMQDEEINFYDIPKLKEFIKDTFYGAQVEYFKLYFTDNSYKLKSYTDVSIGKNTSVEMNLRNITQAVLNSGTRYFFAAHNHPDASSRPSDEDILLTKKMISHLRSMDIHLLDHFVVGNDGITSMRQAGLIYDHES